MCSLSLKLKTYGTDMKGKARVRCLKSRMTSIRDRADPRGRLCYYRQNLPQFPRRLIPDCEVVVSLSY